jgi:hypothetical protein
MAALPEAGAEPVLDEEVWKKVMSVPFPAQLCFFANIHWATLTDTDKATMAKLLAACDEQHKKFGAKAHQVSYPQFCKILQDLEGGDDRVAAVLKEHGDRSSMSKRFQELGFKLRGDTTLIEALLFIFGEPVAVLTSSPPTPCDAALRERKAELAALEKKMQDLVDEKEAAIAAETKAQDDHKPMDATKARAAKDAADKKIRDIEITHRKEVKAATKAVTGAESDLAAEKSAGTEADAYVRTECEKAHITFVGW